MTARSIFVNALAHSLRRFSPSGAEQVDAKRWAQALDASLDRLKSYTPAQPGDRTLIDALHPFVAILRKTGDVRKAAEAARQGADDTKGMKASLGRSVYVGGKNWQEVPDPGAYGLSEFLQGLAEGF